MSVTLTNSAQTVNIDSRVSLAWFLTWLLIATVILASFGVGPAEAKDYSFPLVDIDVTINTDGSFDFVEKRTFDFDGDFSWAEYHLSIAGAADIEGFQVSEDGRVFTADLSGQPGTMQINKSNERLYAKWLYRADNEQRTFTIRYRALDAVRSYSDVGEFYWKVVGPEWDKGVGLVRTTIHLPPGAEKADLRAWGHGPLNGNVEITDGKTIRLEVEDLAPNTFVEARVAFPTALIPNAQTVYEGGGLPAILAEEEKWAATANRTRLLARIGNIAGILVPLIAAAIGFFLWRRHGREYSVGFDGRYYRELPAEYPPAITGYLWGFGIVGMENVTATLMDLGRRGHVKIEESEEVKTGFLRTKVVKDYIIHRQSGTDDQFYDFEEKLLAFLFGEVGKGDSVSIEDLKDYAQSHTSTFQKFLASWKKSLKRTAKKHHLIEETGAKMMWANIALSVIVMLLGLFLILGGMVTGFFALLAGGIQAAFSPAFKRRSWRGALQFRKWRAFRRFLKDFSRLDEAPPSSMAIWEHYLVYAVTLGVAKEVIEQLQVVMPKNDPQWQGYMGPAWYQSSHASSGIDGLNSLNTAFSSMTAAATSAMSSGSGGGGGFSGGGGGGGGAG